MRAEKLKPIEGAEVRREEARIRRRKTLAYLRGSAESGGWFRLNDYEKASQQLPTIMRGITSLQAAIDQLVPEDISLVNKLARINELARTLAERERRVDLRRETWRLGSNMVLDPIRLRAKQAMFGVSKKEARMLLLPTHIVKMADDMAADAGRALAWETISDLPELLGNPNVYLKYVRLNNQGAVWIRPRMVEENDNASERIVFHMAIIMGGEAGHTVLACAAEGDQQFYFAHGWEETCRDIKSLAPDAPERYIY